MGSIYLSQINVQGEVIPEDNFLRVCKGTVILRPVLEESANSYVVYNWKQGTAFAGNFADDDLGKLEQILERQRKISEKSYPTEVSVLGAGYGFPKVVINLINKYIPDKSNILLTQVKMSKTSITAHGTRVCRYIPERTEGLG